jgi:hypothetical protein
MIGNEKVIRETVGCIMQNLSNIVGCTMQKIGAVLSALQCVVIFQNDFQEYHVKYKLQFFAQYLKGGYYPFF